MWKNFFTELYGAGRVGVIDITPFRDFNAHRSWEAKKWIESSSTFFLLYDPERRINVHMIENAIKAFGISKESLIWQQVSG